jgi:predicted flap endonuclease-1-like 5' DNA nuclease
MASVTTIEGIGPRNAGKLQKAGIRTCEKLLEEGATRKGRNALAKETGFDAKQLLEWVNRADLMRVKGVSRQYSDLLEAAGVDTVKELRRRNAENLTKAMEDANSAKRNKLVQRTPSAKVVQKWIDHANELDPVVKH